MFIFVAMSAAFFKSLSLWVIFKKFQTELLIQSTEVDFFILLSMSCDILFWLIISTTEYIFTTQTMD